MNTKTTGRLLFACVVIAASSGCTTGRKDLVRIGSVKIVTVDGGRTEVLTPSVYEDAGTLVISGQVRRPPTAQGVIAGDIHIEHVSSDGSVLQKATEALGMNSRRGRTQVASYTARLPWRLTPGSTFRVSLSGDEHTAE